MSLEREETLKCPKCKTENKFHIYDSINVTLDPELKKKVLDGSLFKMKCAECGTETVINYDTLYHDMSGTSAPDSVLSAAGRLGSDQRTERKCP